MPDDSTKINQSAHSTSAVMNNSVTTSVPQHLQYIVIDSSNGFLQAVPTTQITAAIPSTTPTIKVEPQTNSNNISPSNPLKMRTSVAIAPKIHSIYTSPYNTTSTNNKSNVRYSNYLNVQSHLINACLCLPNSIEKQFIFDFRQALSIH